MVSTEFYRLTLVYFISGKFATFPLDRKLTNNATSSFNSFNTRMAGGVILTVFQFYGGIFFRRETNRLIFPVQVRFGFHSGFKFRFSSG